MQIPGRRCWTCEGRGGTGAGGPQPPGRDRERVRVAQSGEKCTIYYLIGVESGLALAGEEDSVRILISNSILSTFSCNHLAQYILSLGVNNGGGPRRP